MITSFLKKIVDQDISEEVHLAFVRYSPGEFVKEPFVVKKGKKYFTVQAGFEYLNLFQRFLAENLKGEVEINGVIESVRDLSPFLKALGLNFSLGQRHGKSGRKFVLVKQKLDAKVYQKLVQELFSDYLLFNVFFPGGGQLKVKRQTTPKMSAPTNGFATLKGTPELLTAFWKDYLFDVDPVEFKELVIEHEYDIKSIKVDEKLLEKDTALARRKAIRQGEICRQITIDGKVVKDYKIKFEV